MPIYEYACSKCGHHLEVNQRIADDPLVTCPACNEDGLERLVSQSSFSLKGSGWYADGYGGKSAGKSKPDKSPESKPEKKAEPKPEKKPATSD